MTAAGSLADHTGTDDGQSVAQLGIRPQTVALAFCGAYVWPDHAVQANSFVDVLGRVGIGEGAARSTLNRMVHRELLARYRDGKRVYLGVTPRASEVLAEAASWIWQPGPVNRDWDGRWTILSFSLPETRRADRHLLRSRLLWHGFGLLQNGMWISPSTVDVPELLADLDVIEHVKVFRAETFPPTDTTDMIRCTWDLDALAERYHRFLTRWDVPDPLPAAVDDLARAIQLGAEWLLLVREDPRLPLEHLPADWPAVRAEHVAFWLRERYHRAAARVVLTEVDRVPLTRLTPGSAG